MGKKVDWLNRKTRKVNIRDKITIRRCDLALLCLNVDYVIDEDIRDLVEELSVKLQKKHEFDTHLFRLQLAEGK